MEIYSINWLAVLACVVISMVIGSVWFGPKTFFPIWWEAIEKRPDQQPYGSPMVWILMIISSLVQVVFLALLINIVGGILPGGTTLASGALTGFLVWLGFVAPASLVNKLFANRFKAWFIEVGHHLVDLVVYGAILRAWH